MVTTRQTSVVLDDLTPWKAFLEFKTIDASELCTS